MTNNEYQNLTGRLSSLADEPAPPSAVDTAWAVVRGRSRLRRRRGAAWGAAAAVTAAAVLGGSLLTRPAGGTATPEAPGTLVAASSPQVSSAARTGTDPFFTEARFGWLPDSLNAAGGIGYGYADALGAEHTSAKVWTKGQSTPNLSLSLAPGNAEPAHVGRHTVPAPPVDGRSAHWLVSDNPLPVDPVTLSWETASGRWAQLDAYAPKEARPEETLLRIAAGARFGRTDLPLPVYLTGLPAAFKVSAVSLLRPSAVIDEPWRVSLALTAEKLSVDVMVQPETAEPAVAPPGADPRECEVDKGVRICVSTRSGANPALEAIGGLPGLLAKIRSVGADEGAWTVDVLR
ncbi:hypothetical protein ACIF6L_37675 [Kitasatospora sp. NPDC086009]|uniref:hypothetical protein n=1 Tax=unclassified Kitasatospora TaxID=2633591 RepID=UPI0037C8CCE4